MYDSYSALVFVLQSYRTCEYGFRDGNRKNRTELTEFEPMTASIFLMATAVICSNNATDLRICGPFETSDCNLITVVSVFHNHIIIAL